MRSDAGGGGALALLRDRVYGPFLVANLVSNCGSWTYNVIAAVVVFDLTDSALATGAVTACLWIASLALQPWVGALTDRYDRRRMLIFGQSIALAGALAMAVTAIAAGVDDLPGPWPVYAATLVIGVGVSFSMPSMQALIPSLVSAETLDQAIALNAVTFNLARAIGPALAGLILLQSDAAVGFVVNAVSYIGLLLVLAWIRPRRAPRLADAGDDRSVRAGLRWVLAERRRWLLLVCMMSIGFATDPVNTLAPPIAAQLDGGQGLVGAFVAAFGVGAVTLVAFVGRIRERIGRERAGAIGLAVLGAGIAGFGIAPVAGLALGSMWFAGAGFIVAITSVTTQLQALVPEELRGRVMALWGVAFLGIRPISAALDGAIADLSSPAVAGVAMAAAALAAALASARGLQGTEGTVP
ncbi:MAG TPA: MFS transporter [Solirubrobacterales bacterium]